MPEPKKLDVEVRNGRVVAVWFGCFALPFRVSDDISQQRADEMDSMYKDMNARIESGEFKSMDILTGRLEGQAFGYPEEKCEFKYVPPDDEPKSREA